jgi:hypothetical protein
MSNAAVVHRRGTATLGKTNDATNDLAGSISSQLSQYNLGGGDLPAKTILHEVKRQQSLVKDQTETSSVHNSLHRYGESSSGMGNKGGGFQSASQATSRF